MNTYLGSSPSCHLQTRQHGRSARCEIALLLLVTSCAHSLQVPSVTRRSVVQLGSFALGGPGPAYAAYGEFAKTSGGQDGMAVGNSANECLFAQPGTGICTVYKSSEPPVWSSPRSDLALSKLLQAAGQLNTIGPLIEGSKWTQITQTLGSSRDLREAVGFLTTAAADPAATAAAKKVFQDLDGVQLAAQKKDGQTANRFFYKYESDMEKLLKLLG